MYKFYITNCRDAGNFGVGSSIPFIAVSVYSFDTEKVKFRSEFIVDALYLQFRDVDPGKYHKKFKFGDIFTKNDARDIIEFFQKT